MKTCKKFTKPKFWNWIKNKKNSAKFEYISNEDCLFAQFLKHLGYEDVCVFPAHFIYKYINYSLPDWTWKVGMVDDQTFGAAKKEFKKLLTKSK